MSLTIKLTSKRQATFPADLLEDLGLGPGDEVELVPMVEDGERVWILRKHAAPDRAWMGSLRRYAAGVDDHSMEAMRESIRKGRGESS